MASSTWSRRASTDANADALADAGQAPLTMARDTDNDGTPDFRDLDSDADGSYDIVEAGFTALDANANGRIDAIADTDRDGIPNVRDGAPLVFGSLVDRDADGVSDVLDQDIDNDGIPNSQDGGDDTDGDGLPNLADLDSDGDGIADIVEAGGVDANGDGRVDNFTDSDGDGLAGIVDPTTGGTALPLPDSDADGIDDHRDVDSDNDGLSDALEGNVDLNNNGTPDFREQAGNLETAVRGVGGVDVWLALLLSGLLAWRLRSRSGRKGLRVAALVPLLLIASLAVQGGTAQAEGLYVGADVGATHLKPRDRDGGYLTDDTRDTGFRLLLGYELSAHWVVEGFYANLGAAGVASINPAVGHLGKVKYRDFGVGAEWAPLRDGRTADIYPVVKAGLVVTGNSTTDDRIGYDKVNSVGFYLGVGAAWRFLPRWTAQAEAVSYDKDERMLSTGLRWQFDAD